jgi:hypothetical protein
MRSHRQGRHHPTTFQTAIETAIIASEHPAAKVELTGLTKRRFMQLLCLSALPSASIFLLRSCAESWPAVPWTLTLISTWIGTSLLLATIWGRRGQVLTPAEPALPTPILMELDIDKNDEKSLNGNNDRTPRSQPIRFNIQFGAGILNAFILIQLTDHIISYNLIASWGIDHIGTKIIAVLAFLIPFFSATPICSSSQSSSNSSSSTRTSQCTNT